MYMVIVVINAYMYAYDILSNNAQCSTVTNFMYNYI